MCACGCAEVTLSALNAIGSDVDIEALTENHLTTYCICLSDSIAPNIWIHIVLPRFVLNEAINTVINQSTMGSLALVRWAGWSAVQVGRHVKC